MQNSSCTTEKVLAHPPRAIVNILDQIVEQKRRELENLPRRTISAADVRAARRAAGPGRDFLQSLLQPRHGSIALIAEVKKASPSAGIICSNFDPVHIARQYERAGASCISVLTDQKFFQGCLEYLQRIRAAVAVPLLCKDFIIDQRQILEAAECGADAILLIAALLDDARLKAFQALADAAEMAALVEVHDESELDRALAVGSRLVGINNRDLKTFKVDLATTERLALSLLQPLKGRSAGRKPILVAESGIHARADVERVTKAGAQAILVGESLMRGDIEAKIRELLGS